jgi:hypothetical protein
MTETNINNNFMTKKIQLLCFENIKYGINLLIILGLIMYSGIQLSYGIKYYNKIENCSSKLPNIDIWLIIESILISITFTLIIVFLKNFNTGNWGICLYIILILLPLTIINLIWLIFGSVMYWKDCINVEPESINELMFISLIGGYISTIFVFLLIIKNC